MHIPAVPAERSRPGMSTDRITAAALQIVDTEGSQALTMRRLGQALDRKVMTLYRYVPSKDALLDGVVARVLTDLAINPAAADWRQELRDLATSFRGLALAHPNAVPLLVTRPLTSPLGQRPPATLRPLENFLELLIRARSRGITAETPRSTEVSPAPVSPDTHVPCCVMRGVCRIGRAEGDGLRPHGGDEVPLGRRRGPGSVTASSSLARRSN